MNTRWSYDLLYWLVAWRRRLTILFYLQKSRYLFNQVYLYRHCIHQKYFTKRLYSLNVKACNHKWFWLTISWKWNRKLSHEHTHTHVESELWNRVLDKIQLRKRTVTMICTVNLMHRNDHRLKNENKQQ